MILAFSGHFPLGGWSGPEKDQGFSTALSKDLPLSIVPSGSALGGIPGQGSDLIGHCLGWLGQNFSHWLWFGPVVKILALGIGQFQVSTHFSF